MKAVETAVDDVERGRRAEVEGPFNLALLSTCLTAANCCSNETQLPRAYPVFTLATKSQRGGSDALFFGLFDADVEQKKKMFKRGLC